MSTRTAACDTGAACQWRVLPNHGRIDLLSLAARHPERYPFFLQSVVHGTEHGRYDILFAFPGEALILNADSDVDFLAELDSNWVAQRTATHHPSLPFTGGWFLYLSYELANRIEPTVSAPELPASTPVAVAIRIPAALIVDHLNNALYLVCEESRCETLDAMYEDMQAVRKTTVVRDLAPCPAVESLEEEDPQRYLDGVRRIQDYIRAGDVFQVNLSRLWQATFRRRPTASALYQRLRKANPGPFAALAHLPGGVTILSSSPERLANVRGDRVRTRPIAGTYPRGRSAPEDDQWARQLLQHPKERAEHVMLIDLERNDLGRVCRTGSVSVPEFMVLESYRHVHHTVSEVSGVLREHTTPGQLIRAVFPGGTITGCPKVRCMQIIHELEPAARGAYTGSLGYLNRDGSLDLNILIRSLVLRDDHVSLRAGAGIVADSDPLRELQETRAKARGLLAALGH